MAKGKVGASNEVVATRWKKAKEGSPFRVGELGEVRYNGRATAILFNGRSLRVLVPDEFHSAGENFLKCAVGFYGPGVLLMVGWLGLRRQNSRRKVRNGSMEHPSAQGMN